MRDFKSYRKWLLLQMLLGAVLLLVGHQSANAGDNPEGGRSGLSGGTRSETSTREDSRDENSSDDSGDNEDADESDSGGTGSSNVGSQNNGAVGSDAVGNGSAKDANNALGSGVRKKARPLNQDQTKSVISNGDAASLPLVLAFVDNNFHAQVLDVTLRPRAGGYNYEIKMLTNFVELKTVTLDAKTLKKQ